VLNWRNLTPPEYLAGNEQQLQILSETGRIGPYEKEYLRKDGRRLGMMFAGSALADGTIIEYCIDASDRKRVESQTREAEQRLRNAHEALLRVNVDLKHFSYAVSHDMQEPLRMVTSYAQLLARDYRDALDGRGHQLIDYAVAGARRMEALLNDLREYWSVNEGIVDELATADSNDVLAKALGYLQSAVAESAAVITHDTLPVVRSEQDPLSLLFQNLIGNAIKYARRGTIPRIRISAQRDTTVCQFSVADNGIGIEAQDLAAIFAPFKRLHASEYPGTGLGLAMCQRIVERYRGRIWVESVPGQGSTFHFTLPVADGSS
jgi:light-regulated signal transduction histidine kinase (bacteriophytochrome)